MIESADIGDTLERLKIRHDGSGIGSGWYLSDIVVDAPSMGRKWTFKCER